MYVRVRVCMCVHVCVLWPMVVGAAAPLQGDRPALTLTLTLILTQWVQQPLYKAIVLP